LLNEFRSVKKIREFLSNHRDESELVKLIGMSKARLVFNYFKEEQHKARN